MKSFGLFPGTGFGVVVYILPLLISEVIARNSVPMRDVMSFSGNMHAAALFGSRGEKEGE